MTKQRRATIPSELWPLLDRLKAAKQFQDDSHAVEFALRLLDHYGLIENGHPLPQAPVASGSLPEPAIAYRSLSEPEAPVPKSSLLDRFGGEI